MVRISKGVCFSCWLKTGLILITLLLSLIQTGSANETTKANYTIQVFHSVFENLYVSINANPTTLDFGSSSQITVTITNFSNMPIKGATVKLTGINGTLASSLGITDTNGVFITRFVPVTSGIFSVNAMASHPNYSNGGSGSLQGTILNIPPTAYFSASPSSGQAPLNVTFDALGSTKIGGSIVSYKWDFGDGQTGSGISVLHTYQNARIFLPSLTVTDNQGVSNSMFSKIVVSSVPALSITLSSEPASVRIGQASTIKVTVIGSDGGPVPGASVILTPASGGAVNPTSGTTNPSGHFTSTFISSDVGNVKISALVTKEGFGDGSGDIQVSVNSAPIPTPTPAPTLPPSQLSNPIVDKDVIIASIGALATIIAAYFGYRTIKKK